MLAWGIGAFAANAGRACDGASLPVDVHVTITPGTPAIYDTKASRELEQTGPKAFHQLGVTRAMIQRVLHIQMDQMDRSACARPTVVLQLSVRPVEVEIARELNAEPCLRAYVVAHEMQHVAVYNASARRAATQLEREMRGALTYSPSRASPEAMASELQQRIDSKWYPRLDQLISAGDIEQDAIDVGQEEQVYRACNGTITRFLQTLK